MRIAVIGGSIAGCAAAVALQRAGQTVFVYEKSTRALEDKGAGIVIPTSLLEELQGEKFLDKNIPAIAADGRTFAVGEKQIWKQPMQAVALHWRELYSNLYKRIVPGSYQSGKTVTDIIEDTAAEKITLKFAEGEESEFDLVICADGAHSFAREKFYLDIKPIYAGYIAWRGTIAYDQLDDADVFSGEVARYYCYDQGHLICFPIQDGDKRLLNWVFYEVCDSDTFETRFAREAHDGIYNLDSRQKAGLHELAKRVLPANMAAAVCKTEKPFVQPVMEVSVPNPLVGNRCVLIGDAAALLRPHTASGATKALQDALALRDALSSAADVTVALTAWGEQTQQKAVQLTALATIMGEALVFRPPAWGEMNPEKMDHWWSDLMQGKQWYATDDADAGAPQPA